MTGKKAATKSFVFESLQEELAEKDVLLSLHQDFAAVQDRHLLLQKIQPKLKRLFGTEDVFICILDEQGEHISPLLRMKSSRRMCYEKYDEIMNADFPLEEGFISEVLQSADPMIVNLEEVSRWKKNPVYLPGLIASGLKEALSRTVFLGNRPVGLITCWSEETGAFTGHHKRLISEVAEQVSLLVTNLSDQELITQREKENEVLLEISNEIAAIRKREHLVPILAGSMKRLIPYDDAIICIYDKSKKNYTVFAQHTRRGRGRHQQFEQAFNTQYELDDQDSKGSHIPVVLKTKDLQSKGKSQIGFIYESGICEFAVVKLADGEELVGNFVLLSESENLFSTTVLKLMQRLSYQVSIAVAKLQALEEIKSREMEKEILLTTGSELAGIRERNDLLPILKRQLKNLSFYSDVTIATVDSNQKTFGAFLVNEEPGIRIEHKNYPEMRRAHHRFPDGVFELGLYAKEPVIFDLEEIVKGGNAPSYIQFMYENGTIEMAGISLRDHAREIGVMFLFSDRKQEFTRLQLNLAQGIGNQLGTVVANILANDEIKKREEEKTMLLSLSYEIAQVRGKEQLLFLLETKLRELFSAPGFGITLLNEDGKTHKAFLLRAESKVEAHQDFSAMISADYSVNDGVFDLLMLSDDPLVLSVQGLPDSNPYVKMLKDFQITELIGVALKTGERLLGSLLFYVDSHHTEEINISLLKSVCAQISVALSNILANEKINAQLEEISRYKEQLEEEKSYLQEEVGGGYSYSDIVGHSKAMQLVFQQLSQVAFANSTVLLLGETGTGKELIARALHNSSPRKDKLMVKVNCAALPANLIESELFGHEKGSFTGATERRIGKFELAHEGTLFLDEIGEMPADLQVKLLRAIQEREIERIGGKSTIRINVRIIAATNRNLLQEVEEGRFRNDLFYRLNVFPITLPPLRERKEDIPALVAYFIAKFSKSTGRKINGISAKAIKELMSYSWPGNVRELEYLVERSILTTNGPTIREVQLPAVNRSVLKKVLEDDYLKTYEENERDHLLRILEKCHGKIYGPGGAAEILSIPVSTLNSRIKKLGIKKEKQYLGNNTD